MEQMDTTATFEVHRPALLALAYRMLGDLGRAEDVVQDAWMRWQGHASDVDAPRSFLLKVVTRLCLNEMGSARARREESRGDRLPEPVDLDQTDFGRVEMLDRVSMAFLVVLQRLTPAERATLLLHDVFDFSHREIANLLDRTEAASRQLLARARDNVAQERRALEASTDEHRRLLAAFVQASATGDQQRLIDLLADDATLVVDAGPGGSRVGRIRNVGRPIKGARKIAAFVAQVARADTGPRQAHECRLNGEPAIVVLREGRPYAAVFVSTAGGKIRHAFIQTDPARLTHLGDVSAPRG
jgi:RNA polymerase sigma-70 factor (ECF subfamily)